MAKVIAFDVYGTLLNLETDEERLDSYRFLSNWLSYHGLRTTPLDLRQLYLSICRKEIRVTASPHPDLDIGRVFANVLHALSTRTIIGTAPPEPPGAEEFALLFRMLTTVRLSVYAGVEAMLSRLAAATRLGVISNRQRLFTIPELKRFRLLPYFESIVFSSDVRACKPDSPIFQSFLQQMGAADELLVM